MLVDVAAAEDTNPVSHKLSKDAVYRRRELDGRAQGTEYMSKFIIFHIAAEPLIGK